MNEKEVGSTKKNNKGRALWTNSVRYIALVCLILIALLACYLIRDSLTLIVIAALVAYLLNPIVRFLNKKLRIKRNLAIALAYIMLIIAIIAAVSIIIPQLTQAVRNFIAIDWPQVLSAVETYIEHLVEEVDATSFSIGGFTLDLSKPLDSVLETIQSLRAESINIDRLIPDYSAMIQQIFSISTNVFSQVMTWFIMFITAVMASMYFCRDGHKIWDIVVDMFEDKYQPEIEELLRRLRVVWKSYFAGELKLMLYIGVITFVVYFAMGMRWALLLGIIAGFCEVVPNIGPILATVPAIISALIFGSRWIPLNHFVIALLAIIAAVVIQQTENIFLVPHIMGNALELHPVVIIIGILTLSSRMGIIGAVFAAPIIALAKEILYFIIKKIKKQDPYPDIYNANTLAEEV